MRLIRYVTIKIVIEAPDGLDQDDIAQEVASECDYSLSYSHECVHVVETELVAILESA